MAYTIPVGGIVETIWMGNTAGQRTMTVLHWKNNGTVLSDGVSALGTITNWMKGGTVGTAYLAATAADWAAFRVQAQLIYPTRYRPIQATWTGPGVGGASKTPNVGSALTRYGETANRHSIGTIHMPALPSENYNDGVLDATITLALGNLLAYWTANNSMGTTSTFQPVLYNRATPTNSVVVIGGTVQPQVRIDRRRTVGLGI